jgi:hypothetical protein
VFVGEGGVQAGLVGDVEDRVDLQELVGEDRLLRDRVARELRRVDGAGVEVAAAADEGASARRCIKA